MIDLGINLFQEIAALGGGGGGYSISNSLRFNDDDSAYLSRTPSVAGNRKTWTWSGWVKRGNLGVLSTLFGSFVGYNDSQATAIIINSSNQIVVSPWTNIWFSSSAVLRDTSGWYHIVVVLDSTEATATDRIKVYINGVNQSGTYPLAVTLNADYGINQAGDHRLGDFPASGYSTFDGYMAEVNFIDGQALTADDFGQIDATTGEWSPKKYSGTYGTNGFYLPFNGNANDDSGNGNNWTENNLASTDYMIDTPTNNFSVLNPLDKSTAIILSEGNLKTSLSSPPGGDVIAYGTVGVSSGKWYMETTLNDFSYPLNGAAGIFGMHDGSNRVGATYSTGITSWYAYSEGAFTALSFNGSAIGMVMQIAIDLDAGKLWVGKDGVWNGSGDPDTGANPDRTFTPSGTYKMSAEPYRDGVGYWLLTVNAGADSSFAGIKTRQGNTDANGIGDFYYTPPTGYLALCTDNLPAPAIEQPETQFNVVLDTGANIKATAEALYDSSLIWIKDRVNSNNNQLIDTVRGTGVLQSNTTAAETTYSAPSGNSVAWVWKAGGTAVTNNDGTTSSLVSANIDAGFSIVAWNSVGSGQTLGHGLSAVPQIVITKKRNSANNWVVQANYLDATSYYLYLQSTAANVGAFGNAATDTVFDTITSTGGDSYISYVFAPKEGFSKFGLYVGNGSADGPFVYTGFKPAFVMIKRTDSNGSWIINDDKRSPYNAMDKELYANLADAEQTNVRCDFLSNGFKVRNTFNNFNASGGTYIYMAFAEAPFKNALAR